MNQKNILIAVALVLSLNACKKQDTEQKTSLTKEACNCDAELALPNTKAEIITIGKGNKAIHLEKKDGMYIMGGDIILTDSQVSYLRTKFEPSTVSTESAAVSSFSRLWPNGVVYYDIDGNMSSTKKDWVTQAIKHWEDNTNLSFVKRTNEANYVRFKSGDGCSAHIGMAGGRQYVTLGNCSMGKTIHEIGHAIGLYHEQTRPDRDNYVIILEDNIESGHEHNYDIHSTATTNGAFDFGSIMLYGSYSFSANGQPTMTKLDGSTFSSQRVQLSDQDIAGVNALYP